jgi:hypothetical protein
MDVIKDSRSRTKKAPTVLLACNGRRVRLNPFVQRFIRETVLGLTRSLDGVPEDLRTINLRIRQR